MTKEEIKLLLFHDKCFTFFFKGIADFYSKQTNSYHHQLPSIDYENPFHEIPEFLYKYIDFNGGILSIENRNIQFTDPLTFWNLDQLKDKTEFWFDRIYMDFTTLKEVKLEIISKSPKHKYFGSKEIFLLLLHNHILNLTKRTKVLCLSKRFDNQALWKDKSSGFCIEYNSTLFTQNNLIFNTIIKHELIGNYIYYVDKLDKYPIRIYNHEWLSNLIFVKNKFPFSKEEEYRLLYTEINYDPVKEIPNIEIRIKTTLDLLLKDINAPSKNIRPTFDRTLIKKVYYKDTVEDESKLLEVLKKYNIPYEKLGK